MLAAKKSGGAQRGAKAREQRPQCSVLRTRRALRPEGKAQLFASEVPVASEYEVGQQQRNLPPAERTHQLNAVDLHRKTPA